MSLESRPATSVGRAHSCLRNCFLGLFRKYLHLSETTAASGLTYRRLSPRRNPLLLGMLLSQLRDHRVAEEAQQQAPEVTTPYWKSSCMNDAVVSRIGAASPRFPPAGTPLTTASCWVSK